ncbi:hypothetical protein MASR2M78_16930 [Treponema sp.]
MDEGFRRCSGPWSVLGLDNIALRPQTFQAVCALQKEHFKCRAMELTLSRLL